MIVVTCVKLRPTGLSHKLTDATDMYRPVVYAHVDWERLLWSQTSQGLNIDAVMRFPFRVGFEVFTAMWNQILALWFVAQCSLARSYQRFGGTYCLHPEDGGGIFLRNVRVQPQDCTVQQTRRRQPTILILVFCPLKSCWLICSRMSSVTLCFLVFL
jgi:hypothetical protein